MTSDGSDDLAAWLPRQRWFGGKARRITGVEREDRVVVGPGAVHLVRVALDDGATERYAVPLLSRATGDPRDAFDDPGFCRALLDLIALGRGAAGEAGAIVGRPTAAFPPALSPSLPARRIGAEQSNTSVAFGDALIMKHFRRVEDGVNPEQEVTRFLTEKTAFTHTPRLAGHLEYRSRAGGSATLAVVQELVIGAEDGWQWVLGELADRRGRASVDALSQLGRRTAELHLALASGGGDPAFAPEPIGDRELGRWADAVLTQLATARTALAPRDKAAEAGLPNVGRTPLLDGLAGLRGRVRIRHHGDFHLGQTLYCPAAADFMLIDFEGEPLRPLAERRRKHTPLRDVAGMLRSIDYAAVTAADAGGAGAAEGSGWAEPWAADAARGFLRGYRDAAGDAPFLPESPQALARALAVFELEKAAYEVVYEANHRPHWVWIPLRGVMRSAARLTGTPSG